MMPFEVYSLFSVTRRNNLWRGYPRYLERQESRSSARCQHAEASVSFSVGVCSGESSCLDGPSLGRSLSVSVVLQISDLGNSYYLIFSYIFWLGCLYLSLRPGHRWKYLSVVIICNHLLCFPHAFRLQVCVILIMGSEVSGKVLSWLYNLLYLSSSSCVKGGSWWGREAREHYWTTYVKHISSCELATNKKYDNYTEYLQGISINGNRFLSLTEITLVIYSNTWFCVLLPGTPLHVIHNHSVRIVYTFSVGDGLGVSRTPRMFLTVISKVRLRWDLGTSQLAYFFF